MENISYCPRKARIKLIGGLQLLLETAPKRATGTTCTEKAVFFVKVRMSDATPLAIKLFVLVGDIE